MQYLTVYKRGRYYWVRGTVREKIEGETFRKPVRESTGSDKKPEAIRYAIELEEKIKRGFRYGEEQETYFGDAAAEYIEGGGEYRYLGPILKELAGTYIKKIKPGHIRELAQRLYPNAKESTWNRQVITPVQAVINYASDKGYCNYIRVRRFKTAKAKKKAIDRDYIDRFMQHAVNPNLGALFLFDYVTAARIGEAVQLQPDNFNLENNEAWLGKTKNGESRIFTLTQELSDLIATLTPKLCKDGTYRVFGYMNRHGQLYRDIRETCELAGLEYLGTHQPGRHSFATETISRNKMSLPDAMHAGNWKSAKLLLETYVHPENLEEKIKEVFEKKSTGPDETEKQENGLYGTNNVQDDKVVRLKRNQFKGIG